MSKIKAVLFDLDGTLRDTRELIYASLDHAFRGLGLASPTRAELLPYIHHHMFVHEKFAGSVDFKKFEQAYVSKVDELLPQVKMYLKAQEVLGELQRAGYKLGLVTGARRAQEAAEKYGIAEYLDVIVGAREITKHKPDPEGLQLALQQLGILPNQVVYVGDLAVDAKAAQTADLRAFIGITHGFATAAELKAAGADYIIDSLAELPAVIKKIEQ